MKRFAFALSLLLAVGISQMHGQVVELTGKVTSSEDGSALPGVSVIIPGTTIGAITDLEGNYSITVPANATTLQFSFVGMLTREIDIAGQTIINVVLDPSSTLLDEAVVTALGISRETKSLGYAQQEVTSEDINISSDTNLKSAIAGKIAGIQIVGESGAKLGQAGRIRIRGAVSITTDGDPLYVVDGIPTTYPNVIDLENVESINVLKGPNATALYGQRAEYGVILINSKGATGHGVRVEFNNTTTFEKFSYLPKYQNLYGAGYDGDDEWDVMDFAAGNDWGMPYAPEFQLFDGQRSIWNGYSDESWGPRFDGQPYVAWYNIWPDSPYYGELATWEAQPDNIKDFYNTGVSMKNTVAISSRDDKVNVRVAYTNKNQQGIIPESFLKGNLISGRLSYQASDKLTLNTSLSWANSEVHGDFDDSYANQTSGAFNSWFNRNLEMDKMRELRDLQTTNGYHASWNYWGFQYGTTLGTEKPFMWYNPYYYLKHYQDIDKSTDFIGRINLSYAASKHIEISGDFSINLHSFSNHYEFPFALSHSYFPISLNPRASGGFGNSSQNTVENNYSAMVKYSDQFGDLDVQAFVGGNLRTNSYDSYEANMDLYDIHQGLILPDVFTYSNTILDVTPSTYVWNKEVRSIYGSASFGYKGLVYLDLTGRQDWSSALPAENNGYFYPSVGGSFLFSELINSSFLSFGKIRAGWAQVGNDVDALMINPSYPLSSRPYFGLPQMYTYTTGVDPYLTPALNTSVELGADVSFFDNRLGLNFTYFKEIRENEIIGVDMSNATGYLEYLTNAGSAERNGIEITLNAIPLRSEAVTWEIFLNYGSSSSVITSLPGDLEAMAAPGGYDEFQFVFVTHELGNKWGQLRGRDIKTDDSGKQVINPNGFFAYETGQYLGSILPDFTGGILNSFTFFKLIQLSASIDFRKGGKFYSMTELWGGWSGLSKETAAINDRGNTVRDDPADGGGVHVIGVLENGDAFDEYVDSKDYFTQFYWSNLPAPYIHDGSYLKLRELSLSVHLPGSLLGNSFIKGASIGFVGRNLWLISVAEENIHRWDPSELSQSYGEDAQFPGTRSYGFNVKLTF